MDGLRAASSGAISRSDFASDRGDSAKMGVLDHGSVCRFAGRSPLTRPSGSVSPLPRGEGEETPPLMPQSKIRNPKSKM